MKIDNLQEVGAREELRKILSKEPQELTDYESKFLRARRSYLSKEQRFKYSGVLYFLRPALYHEVKTTLQFLSKFTKEIIFGVIVAIVVLWIVKLSGWKP